MAKVKVQNNLKKLLILKDKKQKDLAEATGLSIQAIFAMANQRDCKISTAIAIVKALGVTLDELFKPKSA